MTFLIFPEKMLWNLSFPEIFAGMNLRTGIGWRANFHNVDPLGAYVS